MGITHVLNVAEEVPEKHANKFTYKKLNLIDKVDFNIIDYFDEACEFID